MSNLRLRREGVAWSDLDGEIVILDLDSSAYVAARGTGAFLVELLVEGSSVDDLVTHVTDTFDISAECARTDVTEFVAALNARNLLEPVRD